MRALLFVSNGHGETAIAGRIARELRTAESPAFDHLPLVVGGGSNDALRAVGPVARMPSGGLVAMGNVRAFAGDVRAGFLGLLASQVHFLRTHGRRYTGIVAVGDVYALGLALLAQRPIVFVGTAKSVHVAGYGPFERTVLRRARRVFVRDEPTAQQLRVQGVYAEAPGNVIVDLLDDEPPAREGAWIGLLPGSRGNAYDDGVVLARVIRAMPSRALFSVAPSLEAETFARALAADGWVVTAGPKPTPFEARDPNGARLVAWSGALGALLRASRLVLGQAGTANEAAAACGVPVVALETDRAGGWYRMRQQRLLGRGLAVLAAGPAEAAAGLRTLLADDARLAQMAAAGRERMGAAGGASAIAKAIFECLP